MESGSDKRKKRKVMMKLWVDKNSRGGDSEVEMKESSGDEDFQC